MSVQVDNSLFSEQERELAEKDRQLALQKKFAALQPKPEKADE